MALLLASASQLACDPSHTVIIPPRSSAPRSTMLWTAATDSPILVTPSPLTHL